jgi:hypothetical protein
MSIGLVDGFNILNFKEEFIYNFGIGNKSSIEIELRLFDMFVREKFYFNCKIEFLKTYLCKYYNISCDIKLKYNEKYLTNGTLFDYSIKSGDIIYVQYIPKSYIYCNNKIFHNPFDCEHKSIELDINLDSLKKFLKILNNCKYYNIDYIRLSGEEVKFEYNNILHLFDNIETDEFKDILKLVNLFDIEKYKLFYGNILNFMISENKVKFYENDFKILSELNVYDRLTIMNSFSQVIPTSYFSTNIITSPIKKI